EPAVEARLVVEAPDGRAVRFAHALIREALYEGIPAARRRRTHLHTAETLAATAPPDADAVAYHFRQAGDDPAVAWAVAAAERVQRAYAWRTAAERFRTALALLAGRDDTTRERGWLHLRIGLHLRFVERDQSYAELDEAAALAERVGDRTLAAFA